MADAIFPERGRTRIRENDLIERLARRIIEETPRRPGFQYQLVDSDLIERLAQALRIKPGNRANRSLRERIVEIHNG